MISRRVICIAVEIIILGSSVSEAYTLRGLVDAYQKKDIVVLQTECSTPSGKAMLVASLTSNDVWFYKFYSDGEFINSGQVKFTKNGFEVKGSLGGV